MKERALPFPKKMFVRPAVGNALSYPSVLRNGERIKANGLKTLGVRRGKSISGVPLPLNSMRDSLERKEGRRLLFNKAVEHWKIRLLHDGWCSIRSQKHPWNEEGVLERCCYCLLDKEKSPWLCRWRVKENFFLFKELFEGRKDV